jgi:hypothetical protein
MPSTMLNLRIWPLMPICLDDGSWRKARGGYERQRDEETMHIYELNDHLASLKPPSPKMYQFLSVLRGNQTETNRFFGAMAGTIHIPEFFMPEHIEQVIAVGKQ